MGKKRILSVFGTRPEAIKMAPLIKEIEKDDKLESIVCVTAQHRDMLDQVMEIFDIEADVDLDIMKQGQSLTDITTRALIGLEGAIKETNPDLILVHGDTSTTFVAALAGFYGKVKIGHVEAGLRTYNKYEPYPEEVNRQLTTRLSDLNFAPTKLAKENLLKENISEDTIFITGNTVIDCLNYTLKDDYKFKYDYLNNIDFNNRIITATAHRRENLGQPLRNICNALKRLVTEYEDVEIVYPVHLNPLVREVVNEILGDLDRVHLIDPIDVDDMHNLMNKSYMVMTDSGGLQEEVPSMDKPVVVLRNVTERPEGVDAGTLKIAGVEEENIYNIGKTLLDDENEYKKMQGATNPFGDGKASKRIVEAIKYSFDLGEKPEDF